MDELIHYFFNTGVILEVSPYVLKGLLTTLGLSALVIPLGIMTGFVLAVAGHYAKNRVLKFLLMAYTDLFRAFPPLVLLIVLYTGMPYLGLEPTPLQSVALGFMLNNSSYFGEILRAGLNSVPKGQLEAARSTGMSAWQAMLYIQVPQAVRNVSPDLVSNMIEVVKMTTLASVVAVPEMLYAARTAQSMLYNPTPIVLAALIYFALLWPMVIFLGRLERRHREAMR